jgi:hypothetical protein
MDPSVHEPRNRTERRTAQHGTPHARLRPRNPLIRLLDPRASRLGRADLRVWLIPRFTIVLLVLLGVLGVLGKLN